MVDSGMIEEVLSGYSGPVAEGDDAESGLLYRCS
jgi:hypothetical protein